MTHRLPAPRLLPVTIGMMAVLLCVRSVELVRAAAMAENASAPAVSPAVTAAPAATAPPVPPPAPPPPAPPAQISDGERTLLLDLRKRRMELDTREAALAQREAVLAAAETRLKARLEELAELQKRLESLEAA